VVLENLRMLFVDWAADRVPSADQLIDYHGLWYKQKSLLWRYILFCRQSDQLSILTKGNGVVNSRVLGPIFFKPFMKLNIFFLALKLQGNLLVDDGKRVDVLLLAL
jgi:hypothetical protein